MQILIPMAGNGKRFKDEGYKQQKPLIPVDNKPMIIRALSYLPKANDYFFICRQECLDEKVDQLIKKKYPKSKFICIDYLTEGQASSCLLAADHLDPEESLLIAACDNGMIYDEKKWEIIINQDYDMIVWSFRNNPTVERNPQMYGWLDVKNNVVKSVSVKKPISKDPINDHAIVGTFYFKKAQDFIKITKNMIKKNIRINNEFYVDSVVNEFIEQKKKVGVFEIEKYLCWGTPDDLKTYEYWRKYHQLTNNK